MKTTFHFQSMLIGAVFSAVMMAMILPTFGQGQRQDNNRKLDAANPNIRYQVAVGDHAAYVIDTWTGEVWKDRDFRETSNATPGFMDRK